MTHPDRHDGKQTSPGSQNQADPGVQDQPQASNVSGSHDAPDQVYGLKFILESGESKLFTSLPISIGRAENNDIVLAHETVSAYHAQVYYDDKARDICILDLDSLNGLFISDQPTRKNILFDGVKIGFGTAVLTFRDTGFIYPG